MPGDIRSLNRGKAVSCKNGSTHWFSPEAPSSAPYSWSPTKRLPFRSRPDIHYKSVLTVLTLTFLKQIISSPASPFCLTSSKTMNHCDKLLTSEIPSRNIVTNRNSAITSFIALDIVSASSINQTIQDTIRQSLKPLCTLQMCCCMLYL